MITSAAIDVNGATASRCLHDSVKEKLCRMVSTPSNVEHESLIAGVEKEEQASLCFDGSNF